MVHPVPRLKQWASGISALSFSQPALIIGTHRCVTHTCAHTYTNTLTCSYKQKASARLEREKIISPLINKSDRKMNSNWTIISGRTSHWRQITCSLIFCCKIIHNTEPCWLNKPRLNAVTTRPSLSSFSKHPRELVAPSLPRSPRSGEVSAGSPPGQQSGRHCFYSGAGSEG